MAYMQDGQHGHIDGERYITRVILLVLGGLLLTGAFAAMIAYR